MPLQSSDNNLSIDASDNGSLSLKNARSSAAMREDDCFLSIVTADLDSFCAKYESSSNKNANCARCPVIIFPSVDCRRRKLIHALISQRYQSLAHASVGVEPDRRPVAMYRDFLLRIVLPGRFKSLHNGSGSMAYSEFAFCLALLEACRDSGEAKRCVEKLYAFRLADQRLVSPLLSGSPRHSAVSDSAPVAAPTSAPVSSRNRAIKPGCERYVPRPMRLLQEQQRKAVSEEKVATAGTTTCKTENGGKLPKSSTAEIITAEFNQKLRISSIGDDFSSPSDSPGTEVRRKVIDVVNNITPLGKPSLGKGSNNNLKSSENSQRKSSTVSSNSSCNSNSSLMSMRFLGDFIGPSINIVQLPVERYSAYRSEPPPLDYEALTHVLEISGFPKDWRGADLQRFLPVATFIHWVDDTHVLAVFKSPTEAKTFIVPPEVCLHVEVRPMKTATIESKYKACRIFDDLVSRLRKPQTSTAVVRRVLNHHLRLGLSKPSPPVTSAATNNGNGNIMTPVVASPLVSGAARDT